ncbi:MAG: globin [Flavobacteriales bacterium]|nr:globin [Flavobacteriales bacterium]|tara:strand:- start:194 stop:580 length:387 start_codon:yes stop_codon:yes gene_type:complete
MKEINSLDDIRTLINEFYSKVKEDELLKDIFNERIGDLWPAHLDKMYRFWQTVLLDEHTYKGSPFLPHAKMPVDIDHFDRWKQLFNQTIDENFQGSKAEEAKERARMMAAMFHHKIEYFKKSKSIPLK